MTDVNRKLADELRLIAQDVLAEAHANHNATLAELTALRTLIDRLRIYAEEMDRKYQRMADGLYPLPASHMYGSKARSYEDMARKLTLLRYGTEAVGIAEVIDVNTEIETV
jgi:hypothetical protein